MFPAPRTLPGCGALDVAGLVRYCSDMTNTVQKLPTAFTRTGFGDWSLTLLLSPSEYRQVTDAAWPFIDGAHRFMKLTWDHSEDTEFGRLTWEVFSDWEGVVLEAALRVYRRINELPDPVTFRHTSCAVCDLDVEVMSDAETGVVTAHDRGGSQRCSGTAMLHKPRA